MKFIKENIKPTLIIPAAMLKMAGLADDEKTELHTLKHSVVVLKSRMTAVEMICTIESLNTLSSELIAHLKKVCGTCQDCKECAAEGFDDENDMLHVPGYLLDGADIPRDAKLEAYTNEEDRTVTIAVADNEHDLSDISGDMFDLMVAAGICLAKLEEKLYTEDIVYGK